MDILICITKMNAGIEQSGVSMKANFLMFI